MKIRTEADIEQLAQKIQQELGIDVRKYQNEEVIDSLSELIIFPIYALNWGLRAPLIALVIWIIGFFVVDLVHVEYPLYFVLGLILFLVNGILFGVLFLVKKLEVDLLKIVKHCLGILQSAVSDLQHTGKLMTYQNRVQNFGLLFKGIIHIVAIPTLSRVISNKVPIIGDLLKGLVKKILNTVADRFKYSEKVVEQELQKESNPSKLIKTYEQGIAASTSGLQTLITFSRKLVQLPFRIAFSITGFLLFIFLWLIW